MVRAKKSLGQHFLKSKRALYAMIAAAQVEANDTVLEIGPGKGILTKALLHTGATVVAVETDADLIPLLEETFSEALTAKKLVLVHADIRDVDIATQLPSHYKIVSNIPYYITGDIIRRFTSTEQQPQSMTLLVQKEVAHRMSAKDEKQSVLSVAIAAYGLVRMVQKVPASDFSPPPKVDSAIVHIQDISKDFFGDLSEDHFFRVVKVGFSSKRKKVSKNLKTVWDESSVTAALAQAIVSEDTRPERIPAAAWRTIAQALCAKQKDV